MRCGWSFPGTSLAQRLLRSKDKRIRNWGTVKQCYSAVAIMRVSEIIIMDRLMYSLDYATTLPCSGNSSFNIISPLADWKGRADCRGRIISTCNLMQQRRTGGVASIHFINLQLMAARVKKHWESDQPACSVNFVLLNASRLKGKSGLCGFRIGIWRF